MPPLNTCTKTCIAIAIGQMTLVPTAKAANFTPTTPAELISAITTANSNNQSDSIDLGGNTIVLTDYYDTDNGLPNIESDGGNYLDISNGTIMRSSAAVNEFRLLDVTLGARVYLNNVTLSGGQVTGTATTSGAGIRNRCGRVQLTNSTISGNAAVDGGGIYSFSTCPGDAFLGLENSTVSGNTATTGGGIFNSLGAVKILDSTIAANTATTAGGFYTRSTLNEVSLQNSILGDNSNEDLNVASGGSYIALQSSSHNLIETTSNPGGISNGVDNNLVGVDPDLGLLADPTLGSNDTQVHPLNVDSPAIGAGLCLADNGSDQRGVLRDQNCDIGAFEFSPSEITVNTNADNTDGLVSNDVPYCTLREAVASSNSQSAVGGCVIEARDGGSRILFANALAETTIALDGEPIQISNDVIIDASTIDGITVDGSGESRVFELLASSVTTMRQISVTGGLAIGGNRFENSGGGIYIRAADLRFYDGTVSGNTASGGYGGGGIYAGESQLDIIRSTISGNEAYDSEGGGVYLTDADTIATITNSTISSNIVVDQDEERNGAGIIAYYGEPLLILSSSTVANNDNQTTANTSIYVNNLELRNSILAGSGRTGTQDCRYMVSFSTDSFSIVEDGSCDIVNYGGRAGDPRLETLGNNGGPTRTHALSDNSIARDTGDNTTCLATDQRGNPRDDGACDVGSFEFGNGDGSDFIVIPLGNHRAVVVPN